MTFLSVVINISSTVSQTTNFDISKLKEFTHDNFEFDENGCKFSKSIENTVGKRRNCSLRANSPFPTVFLKKKLYCRPVKTGLIWESVSMFSTSQPYMHFSYSLFCHVYFLCTFFSIVNSCTKFLYGGICSIFSV